MYLLRKPAAIITGVLLLLLCACGSGEAEESGKPLQTVPPTVSEKMAEPKLAHRDDIFEMKLNIDKTAFKVGEPIDLSASLTYVGEEESITVWGSSSAKVIFTITDGKDFTMDGIATMDLVPLKIARGETLEYPFFKSGGYSPDGQDAEFWKKFYSEKELLLPAGTYLISAHCNFSLTEEVVDSHYNGEVYIAVTVSE